MLAALSGFHPRVACRSSDYRFMSALVGAGVGVALVPSLALTGSLAGVTDREREVLTLIARGLSNAEIAQALHVTMAAAKDSRRPTAGQARRPRPGPARHGGLRNRPRAARVARAMNPTRSASRSFISERAGCVRLWQQNARAWYLHPGSWPLRIDVWGQVHAPLRMVRRLLVTTKAAHTEGWLAYDPHTTGCPGPTAPTCQTPGERQRDQVKLPVFLPGSTSSAAIVSVLMRRTSKHRWPGAVGGRYKCGDPHTRLRGACR
jgi:Bacterial regulatory proteins, luxR family